MLLVEGSQKVTEGYLYVLKINKASATTWLAGVVRAVAGSARLSSCMQANL
jgi:hypothetical protein